MRESTIRTGVFVIMGFMLVVIVLLLANASRSSSSSSSASLAVQEVTAANLEAFVRRPDAVLLVHAPWCGHCNVMMPEFEKAASRSQGPVVWGRCDADQHPEVVDRLNIEGFPSCFRFREGRRRMYMGDRSADSLLEFAS